MKLLKQFKKKMFLIGLATTSYIVFNTVPTFAASSVTLNNSISKLKSKAIIWDDVDDAPALKVILEDAYKIRGEQEKFELELENAKWYEGRDTTLYIENAEGIAVYEASMYVTTDTKAEVQVNIPKDIEEDEDISFTIPLLIKTKANVEQVSVKVNSLEDETQLVKETEVLVAGTSNKKMTWEIGDIPEVGEGEVIAPIYFKETFAGALGSREIEVTLNLQNRYLRFDEPNYVSKQENSDDIEYELDIDQYLEYSGGFEEENQRLQISINKDGKTMRVRMSGSVPASQGIMMLKNLPVRSTDKDIEEEDIEITLYGDEITAVNQEVVVGYFKPNEEKELQEKTEAVQQEEIQDEKREEVKQEEIQKVEPRATKIKFPINMNYYIVDDIVYQMDGKTYIKEPGYTMVPIRFVAEALGATNMTFAEGKVYFEYNNQHIILETYSKEVSINGQIQTMEIPLELTNNRVYAPMGEVANLLGVAKSWDAKTRSACFSK